MLALLDNDEPRVVDEYDLFFVSGVMFPVTIDRSQGDTVDIGPDFVKVFLAAKASLSDPDKIVPAEDHTFFTKHLIAIQHRQSARNVMTPDQRAEFQKTFKKVAGQIH